MIELTRLNDTKIILNADLIESIEEVPDTVLTLTTGKKMFVKENRYEIRDLVIRYKQEVFNKIL
jgi:flagellar protein FlbD